MDVLLTFTGFHDPYTVGLIGQEEQAGPIISLIKAKIFDRVILFSTPKTDKNTIYTADALKTLYPKITVEVRNIHLEDPTDYISILRGLRPHIHEILENALKSNYFISVSSGTPQMHACWILLAACGEIPAHILNVRPIQFVSKDLPLITEFDLTSPDLPVIRSNICKVETSDIPPPDLDTAIREIGIFGDHPSIRKSLEIGATLAPATVPILILGETGTGKELLARLIHRLSGRELEKFIPVNCAAIPKELFESTLFGHKKGSFTGATTDLIGKFDLANHGTLFLDELAELPVGTQAKLLRVLQDGIVEPIGEKKPHKVDVRIIAATNQDLRKAVREGRFREDLYYRINLGEIHIPPLRERKTDIPKIALYILDRVNSSLRRPKRLSPNALTRLQNHSWPGNIRDLENVIERSVRLARKEILDADDLILSDPVTYADPLSVLPDPHEGFSLEEYLTSARKQLILHALEMSNGNQSEAARLLGISPQAINKFLQKR